MQRVTAAPTAFVYMLRCGDGSLYCGWTIDLSWRFEQHQAGKASRYTRARLPVELAWSMPMASRSEAMREEARIKRLSRARKLRLIDSSDADQRGRKPARRASRTTRGLSAAQIAKQIDASLERLQTD